MQTAPLQRTQTQTLVRVNSFIRSVYNWMAGGLAITGILAYAIAQSDFADTLQRAPGLMMLFIIAELALVFILAARVQKLKASTATVMFVVYAALNGVTLSTIFLYYKLPTITSTFFVCAATFMACSIYGMTTKRDLTGLGGFMTMGLIGIIIATIVNMFILSSAVHMIISYLGVLIFVGLTAYDTQKLKHMAMSQPAGVSDAVVRKGTIMGALTLYLDFINLFLFLLRIFGGGRD